MAYVHPGTGVPDYFPCQYGRSRLTFRGPRRDLTGEYIAMLGGSETFGRFVLWPALCEDRLGIPVANLGCLNAGPDVFLSDAGLLEVAGQAHVAVLQIVGAQNLSNRFYSVHPRRNDRFLAATPLLRGLYRDVDFTEIHFTRHLIAALRARGPERFAPVAAELRQVWVERMGAVLTALPKRRVLVWTDDVPPPEPGGHAGRSLLVDLEMIRALAPMATAQVVHVTSDQARAEGLGGMQFGPAEERAAHGLPGPAAHQELADRLVPVIEGLL
jgi:Domain of unknown function (DUF6473)